MSITSAPSPLLRTCWNGWICGPANLYHVWNATNGERLETYVIAGEPGSGTICMNGPAAHRIRVGDVVIVAAFTFSDEPVQPKQILVDERNRYLKDL